MICMCDFNRNVYYYLSGVQYSNRQTSLIRMPMRESKWGIFISLVCVQYRHIREREIEMKEREREREREKDYVVLVLS